VGKGLEKSTVMVLHEIISVPDSARTDEQKEEESLSSTRKVSHAPPVHLY